MSKSKTAKRRKRAKVRAAARASVPRPGTTVIEHNVPAPPASTADAFDQWLISLWTLRIGSVTLALALCAAAFFAFVFNDRERVQQAYDRAQACTAGVSTNCLTSLDATISGKSESGGGKIPRQYHLALEGSAPASGQFTLTKEPAWDGMNIGDNVTATVWNDEVVHITDGPISADTTLTPSIQTATDAALLASSIAWVVAFALFTVRVAAARRGHARGWSRALIPLNPVVGASVFLFPFGSTLSAASGSALVAVLSGVGVSVVAGSYFVVNWVRKRRQDG